MWKKAKFMLIWHMPQESEVIKNMTETMARLINYFLCLDWLYVSDVFDSPWPVLVREERHNKSICSSLSSLVTHHHTQPAQEISAVVESPPGPKFVLTNGWLICLCILTLWDLGQALSISLPPFPLSRSALVEREHRLSICGYNE